MKNASAKNTVAVLHVAVMALALSVGAFAGTAYADDYSNGNLGYLGGDSGYTSYDTTGYQDFYTPDTQTSYDTTGYQDYYTPNTQTSYDTTGYQDYYTPDTQTSYDTTGYQDYYTPSYAPSYSSSPTYGTSYTPTSYGVGYAASPSYGVGYAPSYSTGYAPSSGPIYGLSSTPASNTNVNTVAPTNTNVNAPTFTVTNTPTNTNTNTATVSDSGNSMVSNSGNSSASTGAITNTFAPVINVGSTGTQQLAQYTLPVASCTIYASNSYQTGYYNQPITLTWSSSNATSAYISPNVGTVQPQGSQIVYPTGYTTYSMTVYGPGGSNTCQTTANYATYTTGYATPAPVYTAPAPVATTPYVSLTQIPYTGFDYGPVGDAMYWAALFALAAAAAYLLVYYVPGMRNLAFAGTLSRNGKNEQFENSDLGEVFKSAPLTASIVTNEAQEPFERATYALPTVENRRITTDSMIVDSSSGTPRIVIARE